MNESEIRSGLMGLEPEVPWAHHFEFPGGIETVTRANEKFYNKSVGLRRLGEIALALVPSNTKHGRIEGLRVLDVGCGEGGHSVEFARRGADVTGIEGRHLYIARANFAARAIDVGDNLRFVSDDVRNLRAAELGDFDLVLAFGILHHLNQEAFYPFLRSLCELTRDALFVYTHISSDLSVSRHRLQGPVEAEQRYKGYLFQEHDEESTADQRLKKVRAALDNTRSFWATQESLVRAMAEVGFTSIATLQHPHVFSNFETASYRPILICRR